MAFRIPEAARRADEAAKRQTDPDNVASRFVSREPDGTYVVTFPRHFGTVSKGPVKLYGLHGFPEIAEAVADGYTMHCLTVDSADRRYYVWQGIATGFLRFLAELEAETGSALRLADIDEALLRSFKAWLDRVPTEGRQTSELTRRTKIQEIQLVLTALMASSRWAPRLSPALKLLEDMYPRAHRQIKHTDILDDAALQSLYIAAAEDCEAIMERHREERTLLAEAIRRRAPLSVVGKSPYDCAAYMLGEVGQPLPPHSELIRIKAEYLRAVPAEAYAEMQQILYPDFDELLPFILLLAVMFAFNPGVVLNMTHDDYESETLFGRERIRLKPFKPRAHRNQVNTVLATDDPDNPRTIFRHLRRRCHHLRAIVRPEFQDRVFVRFSRAANRGVAIQLSDSAMRDAIARFCERHADLEPFQLRQIRPTTLDLVHEISGGDILAMKTVANHEDANTTLQYYTSAAFQRRNEEMLAAGMEQLERKYRSVGRVDPVERHRLRTDLGSATPGFACLDPRNSPQKGEKPGRLCEAYGRCPACELAMIDTSSPHSYAYLMKLNLALDEAAGRLGAPWLARWGLVKERVTTFWSRLFTDKDVIARGVELATLTFPDLPKLD